MKKLLLLSIIIFFISTTTGFIEAQESGDIIDLSRIVVTASRIAQHGYKISSDVTVIDQKDIAASNAQTISELLQQEPGINTFDNGTPKTETIDIRGFGSTANRNVLVLVNDRKVNSIDNSGPDTLQIPLESVERIEIIRGVGSVLYGDNAVGGVVNIITKKGRGDLSGKLSGTYGSFRTSGIDMEVSGSKKFDIAGLDNDISYYIYSKYYDTGGYRANSDLVSKDYNMRLDYKLSDKISVKLATGWHEDDYGLPGGLRFSELESLGRKGSADPDDFASTKDRFIQLALDIKPWPEDIDLGHFVVDFSYRNRDTYASFVAFDFNTKREIDSFGLNSKYIFDKTLFDKEFNFVVGIDYYDTDNDILGSGSNGDRLTISKEEFGAYLFAEYEILDHVFVNLGTRFQEAGYVFDQEASVVSYDTESPKESVNSFGMKYEYALGSNIFFDVQQTFRYLTTDEWYNSFSGELNTDLEQQTGIQYELGWKHNFDNTTILSLTSYWMDLKDEIYFNPDSGFFGSNDNYDKTRRIGAEIGQKTNLLKLVDLDFLDKCEFFTNYTYQSPKFIDGANDKKLIPMVPQHQASMGMNMKFLESFNVSFSGKYVGSSFAINDTLNETPAIKPYFIMDGKFSWETDNLEIYAALNNIFDEKYYSYVSKATGSTAKDHYPAPQRNYNVGVKLKF